TLSLRQCPRETIEDKPVATMQTQPVLDQFNDDFVRDEAAASEHFGSLLPQRRSQIAFTAQDRARRSDRNAELARNHFRLGSFAGTGRTKKNEPPFHLSPVKKKGDPGDHEDRDPHIKPHQCSAGCRLAANVSATIEGSPPDSPLAQKAVVVPLTQARVHWPQGAKQP